MARRTGATVNQQLDALLALMSKRRAALEEATFRLAMTNDRLEAFLSGGTVLAAVPPRKLAISRGSAS